MDDGEEKRFYLTSDVTVSAKTTVRAPSLAVAIEIAKGREVSLSEYAWHYDLGWIIEDADGEPKNIRESPR